MAEETPSTHPWWQCSLFAEKAMLQFSATDWKLPLYDAVSQTQYGCHGWPKFKPSEEWSLESMDDWSGSSSKEDALTNMKKPASTREIVELDSTQEYNCQELQMSAMWWRGRNFIENCMLGNFSDIVVSEGTSTTVNLWLKVILKKMI